MSIHPIPPPEDDPFQPSLEKPKVDAVLEAWAETVKADTRTQNLLRHFRMLEQELGERSRQAILMRQVANLLTATAGPGPLAHLILEVFENLLGARQGLVWVLGEDRYLATHGMGFDRKQLNTLWLPVPHPFPHYPVLIYQWQFLEVELLPPGLKLIQARPEDGLFLVPFEHQTLLVGFAVLSIPRSRSLQAVEQESMEILQRLFAAALHGSWMMLDLQHQREFLREEARSLKVRAEHLDEHNRALRQGHSLQAGFLAYAARALRDQLHGILATMGQARLDRSLDEAQREGLLLDGLLAGKHMAEVLRVLSELSKPERAEAPPQPLTLKPFFEDLHPLVEGFLRREGGVIIWPETSDLPEVLVDREALRQVILNLCAGALHGSGDGSLKLWIEREPTSIVLKLWTQGLDLGEDTAVFNTPKALLPEGTFPQVQGGQGLGLVMCHELMIAMGCDLTLERDAGGTTIALELPLA